MNDAHYLTTLGAHTTRLDYLERDHTETRRRLDIIAATMAEGDRRIEGHVTALDRRVSGLEDKMSAGFSDLKTQLSTLSPEAITLSIGKGRAKWNMMIIAGIAISIILGVLDKMGYDTAPLRETIGIATAVGAAPAPDDIDGDALRGTLP